ncbi:hypothetical protein ACLOJK_016460, partial [Asimina triloba]
MAIIPTCTALATFSWRIENIAIDMRLGFLWATDRLATKSAGDSQSRHPCEFYLPYTCEDKVTASAHVFIASVAGPTRQRSRSQLRPLHVKRRALLTLLPS